jgi:hypothetical protein
MTEQRAKKPRATPIEPLSRLRRICLAFPEAAEVEKHSRPVFQVRDKTFVMYMDDHHGDGRLAIWCKATHDAQRMIIDSDPDRFFVPPYVGPSGWIGVRLEGRVDWDAVTAIVTEGYRMTAPKRVAATLTARPDRAPPRRRR